MAGHAGARLTLSAARGNRHGVIRFLATLAVAVSSLLAEDQVNPPEVEPPPAAATKSPGPSIVAVAFDARAVADLDEDRAVTAPLVDALVRTVTGAKDTAAAWRTLVGPEDRVGIKVTAHGGRYFGTRRGVIAAVVAGVRSAGVKEVFVWDKSAAELRAAGITAETVGCEVRAIEPPRGWDGEATVQAPCIGKLIWGDFLFAARAAQREPDLLSSKSNLASLLTRGCTKFINIPALADEAGCGVAGALHSAVIGNLDNWRRFTSFGEGGAAAIAEIYADKRIGGKCVLHILDAMVVTYAGGPGANPRYSFPHASLYASRDPVALDTIGLRLMERWRVDSGLAPIGTKAAWLQGTTVGNSDDKLIQLKTAR